MAPKRIYGRKRTPLSPSGRAIGLAGFLVALLVYVLTNLSTLKSPTFPVGKPAARVPGAAIAGVPRIVDGDTVKIGSARVRLYGIDAPEHKQTCDANGAAWACGQASTDALTNRIGGRAISCAPRDTDRYGRTVAVCSLDGVDLNAWMVENGWALAYRQYSADYVGAEERAQTRRLGIWTGSFENPADWRREHRRG